MLLLFLLQCCTKNNVIKHAIDRTKMGPGPKIEHHHMNAMLYKILHAYSQIQNNLTLHQPKRSSNKIRILRMKFELEKNELNIPTYNYDLSSYNNASKH